MQARWIRAVGLSLYLTLGVVGCTIDPTAAQTTGKNTADPSDPSASRAQTGAWGLDLQARDTTVRPGDDFYRYAQGKWLDANHIPPDRGRWDAFDSVTATVDERLRTIAEALPNEAGSTGIEQKVGDFYRAYLDTGAIDGRGLAPAVAGLAAIDAARTHEQLAALMNRPDLGLTPPLQITLRTDEKNPDRYIVVIGQNGLSMPERDYYLKESPEFVDLRAKFVAHVERMLTLSGERQAGSAAQSILDIETRIAKLQWPVAQERERDLTYNLRTRKELERLSPGFPWQAFLGARGLATQPVFIVREIDATQGLTKLFLEIPVKRWHAYFKYQYLVAMADVLPAAIDTEKFAFYGYALNGQQRQRERWQRAVVAVNAGMGDALGRLYVERYFPPAAKQKAIAMVEYVRAAYAARISQLTWMSEETKKAALEKLATIRPKIGYPQTWRDYSKLEVRDGDAFGNVVRARMFEWDRQVGRLGKPTDRSEWRMTPQTVNGYYDASFNEIGFPAAVLQAPIFDPNADDAVNYGAIGAGFGHDMGHAFDDQGSKSDARGVLRTWWLPQDEVAFRNRVDRLITQYDQFEALPGLHVNGKLTLGENIGDVGGLAVAYDAYHLSLGGRKAPVLDGLSGDQRFFLAFAQIWRAQQRDEYLRNLVMSNPHSPEKFRVNGTVRNLDAWYEAFNVKPSDKMYLPREQRVRIW